MRVRRAETWEEVEAAAIAAQTCIRPNVSIIQSGPNWENAKKTWLAWGGSSKDVVSCMYFQIWANRKLVGYIRLLALSLTPHDRLWAADFIKPMSYKVVVLAARAVTGSVVVKKVGTEDDKMTSKWPRFTIPMPLLDRYPYSSQKSNESTPWMLVKA